MTTWTDEQVQTLVTMWTQGATKRQIANKLDKSVNAIKMYLERHRNELGLKRKCDINQRPKSQRPQFDREWYGAVPFGHWSITKPWRVVG